MRELAAADIRDMAGANQYLQTQYRPAFNLEFARPALEVGSAFVPHLGVNLQEILCEHFERQVWTDNCVSFQNLKLQIPKQRHRCHFVKIKVRVHRHLDDTLAIYHGPRCLARYTAPGPTNRGNSMCCRVIPARGAPLCLGPNSPDTEQQKRTTHVLQNRTVPFATNRK